MTRVRAGVVSGELLRWSGRLVLGLYLSTLGVFVALELSIDGGMRSVVLPPGQDLTDPRVAPVVEAFHLDDPVIVRHLEWIKDAVQGDFNRSSRNGQPVTELLQPRVPISLEIALVGLAIAVAVGLVFGVLLALLEDRRGQPALSASISVIQSMPAFMLATLATGFVAARLGWFPASGWTRPSNSITGNIDRLVLPVMCIALPEAAVIARVVANSLRTSLGEEFVVAARAKGLPSHTILFRHALRPASFTLLTQVGLIFGWLLGGVIVVEKVFGIGGTGRVLEEAALDRGLHMLLAITSYIIILVVTLRAVLDLLYRWADPRIR